MFIFEWINKFYIFTDFYIQNVHNQHNLIYSKNHKTFQTNEKFTNVIYCLHGVASLYWL